MDTHPDWHPASPSTDTRNPLYGDTLTPDQLAAGWHYCPAFDGLLTQGERPEGGCFCGFRGEPTGFTPF